MRRKRNRPARAPSERAAIAPCPAQYSREGHNGRCFCLLSEMTFHGIFENPGRRSAIGFALSLLLHAGLLLFVLERAMPPMKESGFLPNAPLVVNLLPPFETSHATAPARSTPPHPNTPPHVAQTRRTAPTVRKPAPPRPPPVATNTAPAPVPARPQQAIPADMSDMLAAARDRRRAAGIPDANDAPDEAPADKDADAVARENIAFSMQSRGENDSGGVFQVTSKGVRTAELIFRGWDVRRRNVTRQAFEIDAGLNGDIDTAIIRKMIELIRQQKKGDFNWESRRLGRVVVLSARPQDDAELEAFLKKDFFAIYR